MTSFILRDDIESWKSIQTNLAGKREAALTVTTA
jgi:hypothetical protein